MVTAMKVWQARFGVGGLLILGSVACSEVLASAERMSRVVAMLSTSR